MCFYYFVVKNNNNTHHKYKKPYTKIKGHRNRNTTPSTGCSSNMDGKNVLKCWCVDELTYKTTVL